MIGDGRTVHGYITLDRFLVGRDMPQVERNLGFRAGRLSRGATFIKLVRLPDIGEFALAALSITAQHRHAAPTVLDLTKLEIMARSTWELSGPNRPVKVIPVIPHDPTMADDEQVPSGAGVPQWRLIAHGGIPGIVVAETHAASDIYRPTF